MKNRAKVKKPLKILSLRLLFCSNSFIGFGLIQRSFTAFIKTQFEYLIVTIALRLQLFVGRQFAYNN